MLTAAQSIAQLYIGYFNRAPEPLGFDFWLGVLDNPLSLAEIATDFSIQPEATALYPYLADPTSETPEAFLTKVYQNLFDRDLDAEGRDFWSEVILSGRPLGDILQEIIRGASPADQAVLDSKAALAEYWVEEARADGGYSPNAENAEASRAALEAANPNFDGPQSATELADLYFQDAPRVEVTPVDMTVSNPVSFIFRQKIADVTVIDDDLGSSTLALSGEDADHFELVGTELFLTDGHPIVYGGEDAFQVTITADDPGIGHNLTDGPETGVGLAVSVAQITVPGPDQVVSWDADDEFLVNEVTASRQLDPDVAVLENGNLVMVWDSNIPGEDNEIQARIFDPSGTEVLGEFTVNQDSNFFQQIPRVVALADGGFVVTWQSHDTSNSETDQRDVRFRIFDEDGDDRTDELSAADETAFNQSRPDIAALEDGRFVITWTSSHPNADGSVDGIRAQTFDPDGSVSTDEFQVNGDGLNTPGTFWYQSDPVVTGLVGGGFAIAWSTGDLAADGENGAVKARIFDEDDEAIGPEFLVNEFTSGNQGFSAIAGLENGNVVVVWQSPDQEQDDEGDFAIKARIFDEDGIPVTNEVLVNGIIDGNQGFADVAATPGGGFVVTWKSDDQTQDDDSEHAIKARAFDANANPIDEEFLVNELTDLSQTSAAIAVLPDGSFAIVWDSAEPEQGDNSEEGIKARVFETDGTSPTGTPAYMLSLENNAETSFVYDPGAEAAAGDPADPVGQPPEGGSDDFV
jgi:hypothetical protein